MKTKPLADYYTRHLFAKAVPLGIASFLLITSLQVQAAETEDADKQACTQRLEQIFQAVQAYRRDHKDLPNWLTDLVPKYIADTNLLICPITRRTGQTHSFEHLKDPKMPTAYLFEFSPLPMGRVFAGGQIRMREFKRRQMGLVGGEVPIVRCHLHAPVLNLGFNGHIYESPLNCEYNFMDVVDFSAFQVAKLIPEAPQPAPGNVPEPQNELLGKMAPEFTLPLLGGSTLELAAHRGKDIVLLDFWATWCGPCRAVMPALAEISRDYADKGVKYYAVNLREDAAKIRSYLDEAKLDIAVPLDKDGSISKKYGVSGIPTMVIVGKDGQVKKVHVGSAPNLKQELTRALDDLLLKP